MRLAKQFLDERFGDCVYSVEDSVIWVSGMNANCFHVAEQMAQELTANGIPCGLVYDDEAKKFGGVQFNYNE